ncbi:IS701 family transposase [Parafrankia sp. FMc6]|uniref:IS701 family transposase n=1 Tax=Parafrankia soli TaxID=2599596 RepID=UPI0034D59D0C
MATPRKPTAPTAEAIDRFCGHFDDLFCRVAERTALRHYLIGLLLPRERNKTLTELAALVPGADRQRLHHFLHDAPWDPDALGARRVDLWRRHPELGPHGNGVLIIDETGDRKRGHGIVLAAQQYIGKLGRTANGVVAVTSHWADGSRHVPLGVRPYRPASRLPAGKADPAFATKPELAWHLIEEARGAGVPFRAVVADCVYGENPKLEGRLRTARIRYVLALRPRHGTWQFVADPAHPPAFTPAEAATRLPLADWRRLVLTDSHNRPLVRHVAELELGPCYGPTQGTRLIAATADPTVLTADSTWFMATNLSTAEADAAEVYRIYRLRDWIEHYYKPAKHELGWADFQVRSEQAIVRHWQLVMLAFTFSLLSAPPSDHAQETPREDRGAAGEKSTAPHRLAGHTATGPRLAEPLGASAAVLAPLVDRPTPTGTGSTA